MKLFTIFTFIASIAAVSINSHNMAHSHMRVADLEATEEFLVKWLK